MDKRETRLGAVSAMAAFILWGLTPIYFKALSGVPALEIIAHRVLWALLLLAGAVLATGGLQRLGALRRTPGIVGLLALTSSLVTTNWLIYVWAVNDGRVLETSLGYFINPLVNVLLGGLVLHERLRPAQRIAVGLAAAGVANQVLLQGALPWVSLVLAATFGIYALLRKRLPLDAISALFVEILIATPVALTYLAWAAGRGTLHFGHHGAVTDMLLAAAGIVTVVPLLLFAIGARRLTLSTLGLVQYLAPSITFLLGVLVYHETFDASRVVTFALIWIGLAIYSVDLWRALRGIEPIPG